MTDTFKKSFFIVTWLLPNKKPIKWEVYGYEVLFDNNGKSGLKIPVIENTSLLIFADKSDYFVLKQGNREILIDGQFTEHNKILKVYNPLKIIINQNVFGIEHSFQTLEKSVSNLAKELNIINSAQKRSFLNFKFGNMLKTISIPKFGELYVGRHSSNHIVLNYPGISKFHLKFIFENQKITVEDLNSKNGVFLNDKRIKQEVWNPHTPLFAGSTEIFVS